LCGISERTGIYKEIIEMDIPLSVNAGISLEQWEGKKHKK
jgi:hypothetical protein